MAKPFQECTRRTFLQSCAAAGATVIASPVRSLPLPVLATTTSARAVFRVEPDPEQPLIPFLSWDTEDGARLGTNLLRKPGIGLRMRSAMLSTTGSDLLCTVQLLPQHARYTLRLPGNAPTRQEVAVLQWDILYAGDSFTCTVSSIGSLASRLGEVELVFPFNVGVTPTTVLPTGWDDMGNFAMPAIVSAPDFGQLLLEGTSGAEIKSRLEGSRYPRAVDLILQMPKLDQGQSCTFRLSPVFLAKPALVRSSSMWSSARRGWFNIFQPSATWGIRDDVHHTNGTPGVLSDNVISDACSFAEFFCADLMLWTPEFAKGISAAKLIRDTIEFWLTKRMSLDHEVIGYTDYVNFLDANPAMLICSWDYIEATGDLVWLRRWIGHLEGVAEFSARRDQDDDGLVEATQSGNANKLRMPGRSSNWYDAVNFGHKDAYANALIYRAWLCLADLESKLGREQQRVHYTALSSRLKRAYVRELYNPKTGWIGCWKSADANLHDYASPIVNGMAIEYGLVEPEQGRAILDRMWAKIQAVGFTRLDLGVPSFLEPIHRSDYLQPRSIGLPEREDGTDTFQQFENGGVDSGHTLHFLAANYILGYAEKADNILRAMLRRQKTAGFQNGVQNGGESTTWTGQPGGYEGYLADCYYFLLAVVLREPACRSKFYRPLLSAGSA